MPKSVLVADPDPLTTLAFISALKGSEYSCAGTVTNGKDLVDAVFALGPWAVAVDLNLPDHPLAPNVGWVATFYQLREIAPFVNLLATCEPSQLGLVPAAFAGGARALAEKPYIQEEVVASLNHLALNLPTQSFSARSRRVTRSLALRFRQTASGGTGVTRVGLVRNISETGIRVAVSEPLAPRTVLFADIELPGRVLVRGRGQVVREALIDRPAGIFEYGLALFDIDPSHRKCLAGYIGRVLSGEPMPEGDTTRFLPQTRGGAPVVRPAARL